MQRLATAGAAQTMLDVAENTNASGAAASANQNEVAAPAAPEPKFPKVFVHNWAMNKKWDSLTGNFGAFKNAIIVQVTNQPELPEKGSDVYKEVKAMHLKSTALHNEQMCFKEKDTIFARQAGQTYSSSSCRGEGGPMPFILLPTFNGTVGDFLASLPPPSYAGKGGKVNDQTWLRAVNEFPYPHVSVVWHLVRGHIAMFGQPHAVFQPYPYALADGGTRPDLAYHCAWFLSCTLTGLNSKKVLFYMNFFSVDVRHAWDSYETDTGLPRHWMQPGDWWMRMKVTRGYSYAMHIVLRGSAIIKASGFQAITLETGEAVVHPVKYYMRLTPPHGLKFRDVLTIII
eukprot:2955853-Prymnesium_polylepis.2